MNHSAFQEIPHLATRTNVCPQPKADEFTSHSHALFLYDTSERYTTPVSTKHVVVQLVEAPRYKPEGRGFDSLWGH